MAKKSLTKSASKVSNERRLKPEDFDAIDEFAAQKHRIGLESEADDDDFGGFDEEAILNVPDEEDFDDQEQDDDFEDDEYDPVAAKKEKLKQMRAKTGEKNQKQLSRINRLAADNEDSDEDILYDRLHREDSDEEANAAAVWGKSRKNYYAEDESADAVEEEAQEARRLQKKRLSALKFDDFIAEGEAADFLQKPIKSSSQKKTLAFDDLEDFEPSEEADEESGAVESGDEVAQEEMDEFLSLLKDVKERALMLRNQLAPLLEKVERGELPSNAGVSFLQLKYHLMLAYCSSVVYYLMLKGRGGRIEGHPIIKRMIRYRLMLEKIRPLEIKMKYQIEKLLQSSSNQTERFRPNPESMAVDEAVDDGEEQEQSNAYRAPKLAPVYYNENEGEVQKAKREEERKRRAHTKSQLLAELRGELDDAPEVESADPVRMASKGKKDRRSIERDTYEEDNFMRFQVDKKEQRRMEKAAKPLDELDELDDFFGELDEINQVKKSSESGRPLKKTKRSESIATYLQEINGESASNGKPDEKNQERAHSKYHGSDESDIEDDIKASRIEKKRLLRQERLNAAQKARGPISYRPISDMSTASNPRPASYEMIKNKGLTPSRSKEQRNPRVRQRTRYEKAVKKLSSSRGGKLSSDTSKPYAGESTGIRTNLTKSVRFK